LLYPGDAVLEGRDIAVIGAGIGGLAAALALARRGARVRVIEQAPALGEVGAGIQVGPNGVAVLQALGLRDPAGAVARLPPAIELREHVRGRTVARLPLGQACVARYGRPYWHLHRADLLAVLAAAAEAEGVELALGTEVAAVEPAAKAARLRTAAGAEFRAELVVAADGVRSAVRAAHFAGAPPRFTGHVAWRGLVDAARLPEAAVPVGAVVVMGPGRHVVTYPLRGGRLVNFVAVERREAWVGEGWMRPDDPAGLRGAFAGWEPRVTALLGAVDETFLWGLFDHPPLPAWTRGRLALLGDACHPMLPFLAQGATMALEDAWALAAELDAAPDLAGGLAAYAARRQPRAARVQRASARNGRVFHLGGPAARIAHLGLGMASRLAPEAPLARFDWLYGADVITTPVPQRA
jgi:salicylate hydroxylase